MERVERSQSRWVASSEQGRELLAVPKLLAAPGLALMLWALIGIAVLAFG